VNTIFDLQKRLLQRGRRPALAWFNVWLMAVFVAGLAPAATINITNPNTSFDGYHAVVDVAGVPLSGTGAGGNVGRMTLSDNEIAALVTARNFTALNAAFSPFGSAGGTFLLNSAGASGAIESPLDNDTKASQNALGGSAIFLWMYKGASRTNATEFFLAKLNSVFPTDPEVGPSTFPVDVFLRPSTIVNLFAGSSGPETFDYGLGSAATVFRMASATPPNQRPIATNGNLDAIAGIAKSGQLVGSDPENGPFTFAKVSDPSKGTVVVQSNGAFVYTASMGQSGADSFTFKVNDGVLDSEVATVSILISATPPNQRPIATNGNLDAIAGIAKSGQLVGSDPENGPFTFAKVSDPSKGTVVVQSNGAFVYTASMGQSGADSFTFKVNDGVLDSEVATVSILISATPPNLRPVATNGNLDAIAGIAKSGQLVGSDPEDGPITFSKVSDPTKGTVQVQSNGSFVYTASVGQTGADSFTFKVNDGVLDSDPATLSITISATPPNQPPEAIPGMISGFQNDLLTGFMTATDPEDDALTYSVVSGPANGTLSFVASGGFRYLPNHQFVGEDSFTFTANDGGLTSAPVRVVIIVQLATPGWTWMTGEQAANLNGSYGTLGTPSGANRPGSRSLSAYSAAGAVLYVFGGQGRGETGGAGLLNDLWRFDSRTQEWTWLSGGKGINAPGNYGTQGQAAPERVPGGRSGGVLWVDDEGLVWLFGGTGRGTGAAATGELNDLWRFNPVTGQWTWMRGSDGVNANGVYGTLGLQAGANGPGARTGAVGWRDARGQLWLFGGRGRGATGSTTGLLNDVWRFDPVANEWAHYHGATGINVFGRYGVDGKEVPNQGPGGRSGASAWFDADGLLWLFGGQGLASSGAAGFLNDLWVFDTGAKQWRGGIFRPSSGTWRTSPGPDRTNVAGVNGMLGLESPNNYPAARAGAVVSLSSEGKLLLFGGSGAGAFNDVWSFDPITSNWTWLKGHARTNQPGIYGQKGVSSVSNTPGARSGGAGFLSPAGNLWVFGGAAGATSFSDGWRLSLPASSSVELEVVRVTTETTAEIEGLVNPGVVQAPTLLFLDYAPMAERSTAMSLSLPLMPAGSGATPVSHVLTGLQPGTDYWVNLVAMNGQSIARSRPRIFRTQGVAAPIAVAFEMADSTVLESNGSAQVEVRLSAPAGELITVPVTVSGTALPSDFTVPVASVVSFCRANSGLFSA
jgi:N-acetylneuraminic acid mutarotase